MKTYGYLCRSEFLLDDIRVQLLAADRLLDSTNSPDLESLRQFADFVGESKPLVRARVTGDGITSDPVTWDKVTMLVSAAAIYATGARSKKEFLVGLIDFGKSHSVVNGSFTIDWGTDGKVLHFDRSARDFGLIPPNEIIVGETGVRQDEGLLDALDAYLGMTH